MMGFTLINIILLKVNMQELCRVVCLYLNIISYFYNWTTVDFLN